MSTDIDINEMDFLKDKLGVELQLGKYAFMVYNVCAKMTIFKNFGHIDTGIELVPVKDLADQRLAVWIVLTIPKGGRLL